MHGSLLTERQRDQPRRFKVGRSIFNRDIPPNVEPYFARPLLTLGTDEPEALGFGGPGSALASVGY